MSMPEQVPPVTRGELVDPRTFIRPSRPDDAAQREAAIKQLFFNANYNDPAPYAVPSYARMLASAPIIGAGPAAL